MLKLLHIASQAPNQDIWTEPFRAALAALGDLEIVENGEALSEGARAGRIRACDVLLTGWNAVPIPASVAADPGRLRYVCHITGEMRRQVPPAVIEAGIPVTNWGDAPAFAVAEGAFALLMAVLKDVRARCEEVSRGGWALDPAFHGGSLDGLNVGVYGCGVIGRRFIEMLRPFGCTVRVFDPFAAAIPEGCIRVDTLEDLFRQSEAVAIHAGLCDATRHSVHAAMLALLPRHGVIVNTARGAIIDHDALLAELQCGRLRAGLDVTEPEPLPPGHPLRTLPNVVLSCHHIENGWPSDGEPPARLTAMHRVCMDNLRRFAAGEPLRWVMDRRRYELST